MKGIGKVAAHIALAALVVAAAIPTGLYLANTFSMNKINYSAYSVEAYEDNNERLFARYEKEKSKTLTELINSYKPYELVAIAENNVTKHKHSITVGKGEVIAALGVKQTINAVTIVNDNNYFTENLSKSKFVSVAKRFYQKEGQVSTYIGKLTNETCAEWEQTANETLSLEDHEEKWGKTLERPSIYIVSSKTILSSTLVEDDENIKITLTLDPHTSVIRYVKQMMEISNLAKPPYFHNVEITYTINNKMDLLSREIYELYDVSSFGVVSKNTKGYLLETLQYDEKAIIPTLTEHYSYE